MRKNLRPNRKCKKEGEAAVRREVGDRMAIGEIPFREGDAEEGDAEEGDAEEGGEEGRQMI